MNILRIKEGYIEYFYGGCKLRFYFIIFLKKLVNFVIFFFMNILKIDKNLVSGLIEFLKMI